jgi:hypothetical protein
MKDRIQVTPDVMREVAHLHDEVADTITGVRAAGDEIGAAVATYGPIMHQVKAAVADLLGQRDAALSSHAARHQSAAESLRREAANFAAADELNAEALKLE